MVTRSSRGGGRFSRGLYRTKGTPREEKRWDPASATEYRVLTDVTDDLSSFAKRMKDLRGDFGRCGYCNELFARGEAKHEQNPKHGTGIVHEHCVIRGICYACAKDVLGAPASIEEAEGYYDEKDPWGRTVTYHEGCTLAAKKKLDEARVQHEEAQKKADVAAKKRAERVEVEGRLYRQAQAHMAKGEHANIFLLTQQEVEARATEKARQVGAHIASTDRSVRAVSFDHLTGTMNFIRYDPSWLIGRRFENTAAFITNRVREKHPEAEELLRSRGFDPVYIESDL